MESIWLQFLEQGVNKSSGVQEEEINTLEAHSSRPLSIRLLWITKLL
jgi:hypothetical protein